MRFATSPLVNILLWTALVLLLAASPAVGSLASIVPVAIMLLISPWALRGGGWREVMRQPAMALFAIAFLALAIDFVVTANDAVDALYFLNFLSLPLAGCLYVLLTRAPGARVAETLLVLCLIGAMVGAAIGVAEVQIIGRDRASGLFGGSNLLPRVAIPLGFFAFAGLFVVRHPWRLAFYLGPVAATLATYYSGSRGAAMAIPLLGLIAAVFLALRPDMRRHLVVLAVLAAAGVAAAMAVGGNGLIARFAGTTGTIIELFTQGRSSDQATVERLDLLVTAWPAYLSHPLLGVGWGNIGQAVMEVAPRFDFAPDDKIFFHADIANFAVAAGIVGIAAWLAIIVAPVAGALATRRDAGFQLRLYLSLLLASSALVFGITDFTLGYDLPTSLHAFLAAVALGAFKAKTPSP